MKKDKIDYTLYLCTDRGLMSTDTLEDAVEQAVRGGCTVVQLRENPAHLSPNLHALAAFGLTELLDPTRRIRGFGYYGFNGQRRGRYGSGGFFGASGKEQTGGSQSEEEL